MGCLIFDCVTLQPFESGAKNPQLGEQGLDLQTNDVYRSKLQSRVEARAPRLAELLKDCWQQKEANRPSADVVVDELKKSIQIGPDGPELKPMPPKPKTPAQAASSQVAAKKAAEIQAHQARVAEYTAVAAEKAEEVEMHQAKAEVHQAKAA